ncbi:MAG: shikimate kinase, partial [Eubacteriales bacterium]|nr:shikimate kinase [Eubacteriales bacterium]
VGMHPHTDAAPVSADVLTRFEALADLIYNPRQTLLKRRARAAGLVTADGLLMLIAQAVRAQEIWNDGSFAHIIPALYENWAAPVENVSLIGLPGCGKTTVGALLAGEMGYDFIDVDQLIVRRFGPIPQLFARGEAHFRACETAVVESLADVRHSVIACGGGTVERPYNMQLLSQMGVILFLDRPADDIIGHVDAHSRPLLGGDPQRVRALERRRRCLYQDYCHAAIPVTADAQHTARQIAALLQEETL